MQVPMPVPWRVLHPLHPCALCSPSPFPSAHAARERIVGWYHTGPRLREADIDIHALMSRYCDSPVLVICEVQVRRGWVGWLVGRLMG